MTSEIRPADACTTMAEVRDAIDDLDRRIVALLGERFRYLEAAARIKQDVEAVRDEPRIADVIEKVRRAAERQGVPPEVATDLYRALVEASVAYELDKFCQKAPSA